MSTDLDMDLDLDTDLDTDLADADGDADAVDAPAPRAAGARSAAFVDALEEADDPDDHDDDFEGVLRADGALLDLLGNQWDDEAGGRRPLIDFDIVLAEDDTLDDDLAA